MGNQIELVTLNPNIGTPPEPVVTVYLPEYLYQLAKVITHIGQFAYYLHSQHSTSSE